MDVAGYQWVVGAVFLLMFPISILLRTFAASASQVILSKELGKPNGVTSVIPSYDLWKLWQIAINYLEELSSVSAACLDIEMARLQVS